MHYLSVLIFIFLQQCVTSGSDSNQKAEKLEALRADLGPQLFDIADPRSKLGKDNRKRWLQFRRLDTKTDTASLSAALLAGEPQTAEIEARAYLDTHPRDLNALKVLVTSLTLNGKIEASFGYLKLTEKWHGPQSDLENIRGLYVLSKSSLRDSNFKKALEIFESAFQSESKEIAAGINLGNLLLEMGDRSKALSAFEEASQRCNQCTTAEVGRAISIFRLEQYPEAQSLFEDILKREPENGQALYRLALMARRLDKNDAKAKTYIDAIRASPKIHASIKHRAESLLLQIQEDERNPEAFDPIEENATKQNKPKDRKKAE